MLPRVTVEKHTQTSCRKKWGGEANTQCSSLPVTMTQPKEHAHIEVAWCQMCILTVQKSLRGIKSVVKIIPSLYSLIYHKLWVYCAIWNPVKASRDDRSHHMVYYIAFFVSTIIYAPLCGLYTRWEIDSPGLVLANVYVLCPWSNELKSRGSFQTGHGEARDQHLMSTSIDKHTLRQMLFHEIKRFKSTDLKSH